MKSQALVQSEHRSRDRLGEMEAIHRLALAPTCVEEIGALSGYGRDLARDLTDGLQTQLDGSAHSLLVAALRVADPLTLEEVEAGWRVWLKGMAVARLAGDEPMITGLDIHALHDALQALSADHFAGDASQRAEQLQACQRRVVSLCDGQGGCFAVPRAWIAAGAATRVPTAG